MAPATCRSTRSTSRASATRSGTRTPASRACSSKSAPARAGAEEAAGEPAQVVEAGAAAPEHRLGAAAPEDVDEEQRLARLAGRGAAGERQADVERDVDRQAPEQRVGEVVEAGQPEQPLGREQRDPERAALEEVRGHPAGLGHRRQHQRVGPEGEAAEQAAERAGPRSAAPVHAAEQRRRELGDGGEADEADRDQRVGFAGDPEVEVAEHQHRDDGGAADVEEQPRQVAALAGAEAAEPQQRRHDEVVADHGRDRDGLDDQHAGQRREAADVGEERQRRRALPERQRQDEGLGVGLPRTEDEQAADGDRQHEDVDEQEIGREQPGGAADVPLVDAFDDHDLELPRQQQHREHGEDGQREPLRVVERRRPGRGGAAPRARGPPARAPRCRPCRRRGPRSRRRRPRGRRRA